MIHQPLPIDRATKRPSPITADQRSYYETLLTHLYDYRASPQRFLRTVGLTSCRHGEGVSTVASHLAIHAAQAFSDPVLLVETPTTGTTAGRRPRSTQGPGLLQLLSGGADLSDCLRATAAENLSVLPAGGSDAGDDSVHPGAIQNTLDGLRREFALVVVDLPPASEGGLCLGIARQLDAVLLIVEAERGPSEATRRAKQTLQQVGANLMGVVFNKRREHVPRWLSATGYRARQQN